MLDKLFFLILNMSFTASIVILFVLMARTLMRKAPKIFSYALWAVVLFCLVCPFTFESVLSILPTKVNPIPQNIVYEAVPIVDTAIGGVNSGANAVLPAEAPYVSIDPLQIALLLGQIIWLMGIAALLTYSVLSLLKLKKRLLGAVNERDNIYIVENLDTPFVMGVLRPRIYLPITLSAAEKEYIILHEQTHIKHFDHVVKIFSFFVLCIHWFNPFVWLAFFLSGKDMEMCCDEAVIKEIGNDVKKEYSFSLLSLATGQKIIGGSPLAFGEGDTKSRIKNVIDYKKPDFWVVAIAIMAVVAIGIGLLTNPKSNKDIDFGISARDVYEKYTLELASSDITGMRQLMPYLNPPAQDIIDNWKQIKIMGINLVSEDIRENVAEFELLVTVKEAPDGLGMWSPGTATHYMYAERRDGGWCVKSYGVERLNLDDLEIGAEPSDYKPAIMINNSIYWLSTDQNQSLPIEETRLFGQIKKVSPPTAPPNENFEAIGLDTGYVGKDFYITPDGNTLYMENLEGTAQIHFIFAPVNDIYSKVSVNDLWRARVAYVGNNVKVGNIIGLLPHFEDLKYKNFSLQTSARPYGIEIVYSADPNIVTYEVDSLKYAEFFRKNATLIFALIDNVDLVTITVTDGARAVKFMKMRDWADYTMGRDVREYADTAEKLKELLHFTIVDDEYEEYSMARYENAQIVEEVSFSDNSLARDIILDYMMKSATFEGVQISTLKECYLIRKTFIKNNESHDYYVYLQNGESPVLQSDLGERSAEISEELYARLVRQFEDS